MEREAEGQARPTFARLSVREAATRLTRVLAEAGIDSAAKDARLLVAAALDVGSADLVRDPERLIGAREAERLEAFALRRGAREPVSRILGARGFYGREFLVTPATLDPRPCTETLIEAVLELADAEQWRQRPIRILDVGTGTGAILLTLLAELPLATGLGTDISRGALETAQKNALALGVADRARFETRRSLEGVEGRFDLLVSNPPYIPTADIAGLDPEVRSFDPAAALDGGADGLDVYRELSASLDRIVPEGWAVLEVGAGQSDAVAALLAGIGGRAAASSVKRWADLGHHERCVAVRTHRYP
jgi:release factor glutamine methyltransferase